MHYKTNNINPTFSHQQDLKNKEIRHASAYLVPNFKLKSLTSQHIYKHIPLTKQAEISTKKTPKSTRQPLKQRNKHTSRQPQKQNI